MKSKLPPLTFPTWQMYSFREGPFDAAAYKAWAAQLQPGMCIANGDEEEQAVLRQLVKEKVLIFWKYPFVCAPRYGFWKPPCKGGKHQPGCRPDRGVCTACDYRALYATAPASAEAKRSRQ